MPIMFNADALDRIINFYNIEGKKMSNDETDELDIWNGPPKDVEGECNAHLSIGDDYGDNSATMRCQLKPGHKGLHKEDCGRFVVTWKEDEKKDD